MKKILLVIMMISFSSVGFCESSEKQESMNLLEQLEFNVLDFPSDQFVKESTDKNQIVLHHTASGRGINGDYRHWLNDPKRIATCVIVDDKGIVNQLFSSKYWGYHLGIKSSVFKNQGLAYQNLNKTSIGVEIDSWGGLKCIDGEWRSYPNKYGTGSLKNKRGEQLKVVLDESQLAFYEHGFKGFEAFEKYTPEQIKSTAILLEYWGDRYDIPLVYNEDIWDVSKRALSGDSGVFTHNSYRKDKSDVHPQKELIQVMKTLG